eukprot:58073-Chlamydomonas_euryale.AAC.2
MAADHGMHARKSRACMHACMHTMQAVPAMGGAHAGPAAPHFPHVLRMKVLVHTPDMLPSAHRTCEPPKCNLDHA